MSRKPEKANGDRKGKLTRFKPDGLGWRTMSERQGAKEKQYLGVMWHQKLSREAETMRRNLSPARVSFKHVQKLSDNCRPEIARFASAPCCSFLGLVCI